MAHPVVLVYSHRPEIREQIKLAVGRRPAPDLDRIEFLDCSTIGQVLQSVAANEADVVILDGEAQPSGGMGISRQLHLEHDNPPPVVLVVRRDADRWLATWSRADAVIVHPIDPVTAAATVAQVLRALPVTP